VTGDYREPDGAPSAADAAQAAEVLAAWVQDQTGPTPHDADDLLIHHGDKAIDCPAGLYGRRMHEVVTAASAVLARLRQVEQQLERLRDPKLTEQRAERIRQARADYEYRQVGNFRACADCYSPITCAEADETRCP
jgi:hypothetical protein